MKVTRRRLMILAGAGVAGAAQALDADGEGGTLYGGKMALTEAFQVAEGLWIGPDSAKTEVSADSGHVYMASDTDVDYYGDGGSWVLRSIGSSSNPVPSVTTDRADIGTTPFHDVAQSERASPIVQGQRRSALAPTWTKSGSNPILTKADTSWNPTGVHWPSVIPTDSLDDPLGELYMYYSPHDSDGTALAYADHPEGPWTDYGSNPILGPSNSVEPSAFYHPEQDEIRVYVNKGNKGIDLYKSDDGVTGWTLISNVFSGGGHAGYPNAMYTPRGIYLQTWQKVQDDNTHAGDLILRYSEDGTDFEGTAISQNIGAWERTTENRHFFHDGIVMVPYRRGYLCYWGYQENANNIGHIYHGFTTNGIDIQSWGQIIAGGTQPWEDNFIAEPEPVWFDGDLWLFYTGSLLQDWEIGVAKADFSEVNVFA